MANYHKLTEEEKEFILKEYAEGWGSGMIAKKIGCHHSTVLKVLKKNGVKPSKSKDRSSCTEDRVGSKRAKTLPTKEEILSRFVYLRDEGRLLNKITMKYIKDWKGYRNCSFTRTGSKTSYPEHRLIYFLETGEQPDEIDHIDKNPSNNHISNLRGATSRENVCNRGPGKTNGHSKYKGVIRDERCSKRPWLAIFSSRGKTYKLGFFHTEGLAAKAYNEKAFEMNGEFAYLNKIDEEDL